MLNSILKSLKKQNYNEIFISDTVAILLNKKNIVTSQFHIIDDVRSATFIALGNSQKSNTNSILIIMDDELGNCMTAVTECWFQKQSIIIITLSSDINSSNLLRATYFNDVTNIFFNILDINEFNQILMNKNSYYLPIIMQIKIDQENQYINDKNYVDFIMKNQSLFDKIFIYHEISHISNDKIEIFSNQYGVFSKYLGYTNGNSKKSVLITPYFLLKKDLNIFNSRYFNSNFKVIVYNCKSNIDGVIEWIKSNNIYCEISTNLNNINLDNFIKLEKPTLLFLMEETQ